VSDFFTVAPTKDLDSIFHLKIIVEIQAVSSNNDFWHVSCVQIIEFVKNRFFCYEI